MPSLPKTTIPAFTCSSWSLQVLSISEVSTEVHLEKGRFQKGYPQTLPLLPIACYCLPLHSTALTLLPTVLQMARWAHLDTDNPWDSTGDAQWCWWSTVLQSHSPSSLQEQVEKGKKSKPVSKGTGRRFRQLKIEKENGACLPRHAGARPREDMQGKGQWDLLGDCPVYLLLLGRASLGKKESNGS